MTYLPQVPKRSTNLPVSIKAKAVRIGDLEIVRTGKQKQEVTVTDQTNTILVTQWEENVSWERHTTLGISL